MKSSTSVSHPEHICDELPTDCLSKQRGSLFMASPVQTSGVLKIFLEASISLFLCPETMRTFSPSESCYPGCSGQIEDKGKQLLAVWHEAKCNKIWCGDPWRNHRIAPALALKLCCRPWKKFLYKLLLTPLPSLLIIFFLHQSFTF